MQVWSLCPIQAPEVSDLGVCVWVACFMSTANIAREKTSLNLPNNESPPEQAALRSLMGPGAGDVDPAAWGQRRKCSVEERRRSLT